MIKNVHGNTVDFLGEAILSGRYPVGANIAPEAALCAELGVSRTVVRESVKSLVAKGLLHTGPKVGTRVLPQDDWNWFDADVISWQTKAGLTPEFIRDLQDLRQLVEPAMAVSVVDRLIDADLTRLERLIESCANVQDTPESRRQQRLEFSPWRPPFPRSGCAR